MKVAIDTNILLDAATVREHSREAQELLLAVANEKIDGLISANSVTDFYYIARKYIGDTKAREAVRDIMNLLDVAGIDALTCLQALETPMKDFEDAVLAVCAYREGSDYIATRDKDFIADKASPVKAMYPEDILKLV